MAKAGAYLGIPFVLLAAIAGGYYAGQWADERYGTTQLNLAGLLAGFGLGLYEVVRLLKRFEKNSGD